MKNTNEINRIKKLFQDVGFMNSILNTLAIHPDVLTGVAMVKRISTSTGKTPIRVIDDLVSESKKNEINGIKELFQDEEFTDIVLDTLTVHPDVLYGATMVRNISTTTRRMPIKVVDDLVSGKYETRFVYLVKKINDLEEGPFANMLQDIQSFKKNMPSNIRDNKLFLLTYQLVVWYISSGLYAQGIFNAEQYTYSFNEFIKISQIINANEEFKNEADEQAIEFILSYSSKLSRSLIEHLVAKVVKEEIPSIKDKGVWLPFDNMIEMYLPIYGKSKSTEIPF